MTSTTQISTTPTSTSETTEHPPDHLEFPLHLRLCSRTTDGGNVAVLVLQHPDGFDLPAWSPGAHIALRLGSDDLVREYSLCGPLDDRTRWTIAVRLAEDSRGGSDYVHRNLQVGTAVEVLRMGNVFKYEPSGPSCFVAGGIGITPLLPMIEQAHRTGAEWNLTYMGRQRDLMPFLDVLDGYGHHVQIIESAHQSRLSAEALVEEHPGSHIFCCGPEPLLDDMESAVRGRDDVLLSTERFSPRSGTAGDDDGSDEGEAGDATFDVVVESTGERVPVPADRSTLEALLDAGIHVMNSCGEGTCGSCETAVVAGVADHRDSILSDEEREEGDYMYVCVSRSRTAQLTLDL
jgi:ferredoxin-NADP reductase